MGKANRRAFLLLGLGVTLLPPFSAMAHRERDYERARQAVDKGEALPLADILLKVRDDLGGTFGLLSSFRPGPFLPG